MGRHLDPDRRAVGAAQAEQEVGDGAVTGEALEQCGADLRVDEASRVERPDVMRRRVGG